MSGCSVLCLEPLYLAQILPCFVVSPEYLGGVVPHVPPELFLPSLPFELRKDLVSVKFVSAILGAEMAASIYGRLEKCVLSAGKTHVHKIPRSRGGVFWVLGGGECRFYFYGRADFSDFPPHTHG